MGFKSAAVDVITKGLDPTQPHKDLGSDGKLHEVKCRKGHERATSTVVSVLGHQKKLVEASESKDENKEEKKQEKGEDKKDKTEEVVVEEPKTDAVAEVPAPEVVEPKRPKSTPKPKAAKPQ